jgi:hypothetical protein
MRLCGSFYGLARIGLRGRDGDDRACITRRRRRFGFSLARRQESTQRAQREKRR